MVQPRFTSEDAGLMLLEMNNIISGDLESRGLKKANIDQIYSLKQAKELFGDDVSARLSAEGIPVKEIRTGEFITKTLHSEGKGVSMIDFNAPEDCIGVSRKALEQLAEGQSQSRERK